MVILAHGALGAFDELIFLAVAVVFLAMMGVSWFRSRDFEPELEGDGESTTETVQQGDRFKLE
jgi:hypothetical protein